MAEQSNSRPVGEKFEAPDGKSNLNFLDKLCRGGVIERFTKAKLDEQYAIRLAQEMQFWASHEDALNRLLIIWDCFYWARRQHIKNTAVSSALDSIFTAYLLEITQVDPLISKLEFNEIAAEQLSPVTITLPSMLEQNSLQTYINSRYAAAVCPLIKVGDPHSNS